MKKLTIAIPTYNGARTIKRTLDSILSQDFPKEEVDIIVCNNASTDNTLEILNSYQSQIVVHNNEKNLGGDRNFELCVERSNSVYVWIVGDDDFLKQDSIKTALYKINQANYACVFVNYSLYDIKLEKEVLHKYLPLQKDIVATGISQFLEYTNIAGNFLSSIIHNKQYFESADAKKFYGTCFLQFGVILDYVDNNKTLIIAEPLVVNMGDSTDREFNAGGVSVKIISNLYTIVKSASSPYFENSVRKETLKSIYKTLKYKILSAKRLGLKVNSKLLKELITNFGGYWTFWFVELILLLIPQFLFPFAYKFYSIKSVRTVIDKVLMLNR